MTIKLITDVAKALKAVEAIEASGAKLATEIHVAACSALYHAGEHGDITIMQRLVLALPGFARRNALLAWAVAHGKFSVDEDGTNVVYNKHTETKLELAMAKPFWEFKPEAAFKPFDMKEELAKLVKRAEKAAKDERNSLDSQDLIAVRQLAATAKPAKVMANASIPPAPTTANDEVAEDDALAGVANS